MIISGSKFSYIQTFLSDSIFFESKCTDCTSFLTCDLRLMFEITNDFLLKCASIKFWAMTLLLSQLCFNLITISFLVLHHCLNLYQLLEDCVHRWKKRYNGKQCPKIISLQHKKYQQVNITCITLFFSSSFWVNQWGKIESLRVSLISS